MEGEIDDDVCCYVDVRAPGHLAAMVFSNTYDGRTVLETSRVITGNNPLCSDSRSIDGTLRTKTGAAYLPTACFTKGQKSSLGAIIQASSFLTGSRKSSIKAI